MDVNMNSIEYSEKEFAIKHLESVRADVRNEIKQRIKQRDQFSVQLTVSLGALVGIAATASTTSNTQSTLISFTYRVLLAAPLFSIYFTTLILYSYRVHKVLASYLRSEIEPKLEQLCGSKLVGWENYYAKQAIPGIRRSFYIGSLWAVCLISPLYIGFTEGWQGGFIIPLIILATIYILVASWITKTFWKN